MPLLEALDVSRATMNNSCYQDIVDSAAEHVRHLFDREATKKPHLDNARLLFIQGGKGFQSIVECQEIDILLTLPDLCLVQHDALPLAAALTSTASSRVVDQDPAHR